MAGLQGNITPSIKSSQTTTEDQSVSRHLVILFSYERSGSTFLGELFNQNPEFFYYYEPLRVNHR